MIELTFLHHSVLETTTRTPLLGPSRRPPRPARGGEADPGLRGPPRPGDDAALPARARRQAGLQGDERQGRLQQGRVRRGSGQALQETGEDNKKGFKLELSLLS